MIRHAMLQDVMTRAARAILGAAVAAILASAAAAQDFDPFHSGGIPGLAKAGDYAGVQQRLDQGDSPNLTGVNGASALIIAAQSDHCNIVTLLLKRGARVDMKDQDGNTALMAAAERGYVPCLEDLIAAHADVNAGDRQGVTALMKAVRNGKIETVRALIRAKADVNATDYTGATALYYARDGRQKSVLDALRAAGGHD